MEIQLAKCCSNCANKQGRFGTCAILLAAAEKELAGSEWKVQMSQVGEITVCEKWEPHLDRWCARNKLCCNPTTKPCGVCRV